MVARTRKAIIQAFIILINQYDFDDITVEMILNEAQVSRSTFYRYFIDKYQVMSADFKDLLVSCDDRIECRSYKDMCIHIFKTIVCHRDKYQYLLHPSCMKYIRTYIIEYSFNKALEITKQNRNGQGFTPFEEAQCDIFCHALAKMYENIIQNKYPLSPVEAANVVFEIAPPSLKYYWWKK